jgi:tetratricopeptide (TPR) repeat protein
LVALVAAVYCRGAWNDFVLYDDDEYIYTNPMVRQGLTWQGVCWAFEGPHAANYHPLTWISHMLDWQCFGPWAGGHHLVSMAIHAAGAVALFWALRLMTGTLWSSAAVAALFALHPLHVESVAWASERKDVLSGLFWMLTLLAYGWYARRPMSPRRALWVGGLGAWAGCVWLYLAIAPIIDAGASLLPRLSVQTAALLTAPALIAYACIASWRHRLVFLAMLLGFLSKAMLVSLPCVLLLLDIWPLGRWRLRALPRRAEVAPPRPEARRQRRVARRRRPAASPQRPLAPPERRDAGAPGIGWLLLEKLPLAALAVAAARMAVQGQSDVHVVSDLRGLGLGVRLANAMVAYVSYLGQMIWPAGLATFYPHPGILAQGIALKLRELWISGLVAGLFLAAVTGAVLWTARRRPYLAVGWFWYLGALVPVIGLMQVGTQGRADRYTYLPLVGIYLAIVWAAKEAADRWPRARAALAVAGPALLAACALAAWLQVGVWRNTYTLFEHAVRVTENNYFAYNSLGRQYECDAGLANKPLGPTERSALEERLEGRVDAKAPDLQKRLWEQAAVQFRAALQIKPDYDFGNNNLGVIYAYQNKVAEADACFQRALVANPEYADVCHNLAQLRARQAGRAGLTKAPDLQKRLLSEALGFAQRSVQIRPDRVPHVYTLALIYRALGDLDQAAEVLRQVLRADPAHLEAYFDLGQIDQAQNRAEEAVACFEQVLRVPPDNTVGGGNLGILAAAHNSLAALYAQQGETAKAKQHHQQAIACCEQLLRAQPDNAAVHYNLAHLYQQDGDTAKAEQHAQETLRIERAHPPAVP